MKLVFSSIFALVASITITSAHAATSPETINYSGSATISEITVVKDGKTTTYDIPRELSSKVGFSSEGDSLNFGTFRSKCAPYLGETPTEIRIPVTDVKGVAYIQVNGEYRTSPRKVATAGVVVVAKGTNVYGTCGGDGKTLTELHINAQQVPAMTFESK
jgi:hypothetical protein